MPKTADIWYRFGVRAKRLLEDFESLDLDNLEIKDLEYLQVAAHEARRKLKEELELHLQLNPDE